MKSIKAVLFDFDGTIADSLEVWKKLDDVFFSRRKINADHSELKLDGMCFSEAVNYIKKYFNLNDPIEAIKSEWRSLFTEIFLQSPSLKHKVYDFIKALKKEKFIICVGTSNDSIIVIEILQHFGLLDDMDYILTCCEVGLSKPKPKVYLDIARAININPSECVVFEDSIDGIRAGKSAGMHVVAVNDNHHNSVKEQIILESDFYIEDYSYYEKYFGNLSNALNSQLFS